MFFSFRRLHFTPAPLPTLAAFFMVLLTGYLGFWQQGRAAEKTAAQAEFEARSNQPEVAIDANSRDGTLRYRRGRAVGEWFPSGQIFIDNKVEHGVAGYHVITPLKLEGTDSYILVNRGWAGRGTTYPIPPVVATTPGRIIVTGQMTLPSTRFLELSTAAVQGSVWQNLAIPRYRDALRLDVLPFVLLASVSLPPLERVSERPDARAQKHIEYMLTWYSLAATVIVLWLVMNTKWLETNIERPSSDIQDSPIIPSKKDPGS